MISNGILHPNEGNKEVKMKESKRNDLRTPRHGAKFGERIWRGGKPVALVKQGNKLDTLSVEEFAAALYGPGVRCTITEREQAASF